MKKAQGNDGRAHQGVAGELHSGRDLSRGNAESKAGSDHLGGVVDRGAGPGAEGRVVHAQDLPENWIEKDRQSSKECVRRDSEAHILVLGSDDGGRRRDR